MFDCLTFEGVFKGNGTSILLAEEDTNDGSGLVSENVPCYVVRDCEENQRVEGDGEP